MRECVDEGIIQAYVDGELSASVAERVAAHALACPSCAAAVSEAENELALLTAAFEPELSAPVPSERLRERLDAAISELRPQAIAPAAAPARTLKGWLGSLVPSFNFAPRQALGFASLAAVVAFAAIFAVVASRQDESQRSLAVVNGRQGMNLIAGLQTAPTKATRDASVDIVKASGGTRTDAVKPRRANRSSGTPGALDSAANPSLNTSVADSSPVESKPLPGELNYLKTIASLTSIIETNGESALRPSVRVDYERNLALVNQAIDATRRKARSNPKSQDAAEFLYSSYQSKIDLLSTVAEQGQMVAVLR